MYVCVCQDVNVNYNSMQHFYKSFVSVRDFDTMIPT